MESLTEQGNAAESSTNGTTNSANVISQQLRDKLKRFLVRERLTVQTRNGETIGEVKDLIPRSNLDEHFNLIVSRKTSNHAPQLYVLNSQYITKIDPKNRLILTTFERLDTIQLPDYEGLEYMDNRLSDPTFVDQPRDPLDQLIDRRNDVHPEGQPADLQIEDHQTDFQLESQQTDLQMEDDQTDLHSHIPQHQVLDQHIIQLLEEKLLVNRTRRKVGEVVVRKCIETRMVEVPVRREKLIVEQVGGSDRPLAEIDLGVGEIVGVDLATTDLLTGATTVKGTFSSLTTVAQLLDVVEKTIHYKAKKVVVYLFLGTGELQETYHEFTTAGAAATVLEAIAATLSSRCRTVQVEIVLEDEEAQPIYQKWFAYYNTL